jgi:signal transduction histidine kinase
MVVTFPVSIRLDLSLTHNEEASSKDMQNVATAIISVFILYLLLLALFAVIYSRITAVRITGPLQKLRESTKRLREKDYSARVDLNLNNEFADLQETFNEMAEKIEIETSLRQKSEEERKRLILDVSHDLKNPLTSTAGYAELCLTKTNLTTLELKGYLEIIRNNSLRASELLTDLFELSKLESPEYVLNLEKTDVSEYLRQICGEMLPTIEHSGFLYEFDIPEESIFSMCDIKEIDRVFHNLMDNAIRYNPEGTTISINMKEIGNKIVICFKDNGSGIPKEFSKDIFKPFVRVDSSRNSKTGGTGLGLSIAYKIIEAHNGELVLESDTKTGACFKIVLPKI